MVIAWIIWLARRLRSVPWAVALGLVLGGALGNLVDRHVPGARAVPRARGRHDQRVRRRRPGFPVFNVADSALSCGVVLAILLEFTGRRRDGPARRVEADRCKRACT